MNSITEMMPITQDASARTIIGDILWPQEIDPSTGQPYLADHPQALPPHGVRHHYALLAALSFDQDKPQPIDLRYMVPPLAKLLLNSDIALFRQAGLYLHLAPQILGRSQAVAHQAHAVVAG